MDKKIGFIGLGAMGKPMAKNLLKANFSLVVYDVRKEPVEELSQMGAAPANSPKEVGESCDVVITSLPTPSAVVEVILGEEGVLKGMREGGIIIDTSTIDPMTAKMIAEEAKKKKVHVLDAPVSGGTTGAENATLSIMVGGDEEAFNKVLDILKVIGKEISYVGPSGTGQTIKLINQMLVGIHIVATAEAFNLATKLGLDSEKIFNIIKASAGNSRGWEYGVPRMMKGDFTPGFRVFLLDKDLKLALQMASEYKVPVALTALAYQFMEAAKAIGVEDEDMSAVIKVLKRMSQEECE